MDVHDATNGDGARRDDSFLPPCIKALAAGADDSKARIILLTRIVYLLGGGRNVGSRYLAARRRIMREWKFGWRGRRLGGGVNESFAEVRTW